MKIRSAALCTLAAVMVVGAANPAPALAMPAPAPAEAQPAGHGVEAPASTIPWSQVGPGWVLATWLPVTGHRPGNVTPGEPTPDEVSMTLYLVDPQGGRYPITTFPPSQKSRPQLIDWSGDRSRALFATEGVGPTTVTEVDLHTGAQRTIPFDASYHLPRYTLPNGQALLTSKGAYNQQESLIRLDLNGRQQLAYPEVPGQSGYLSTPDGTELVLGSDYGKLTLMGNDGTQGRDLPISGETNCDPVRFYDDAATTVLARCGLAGPRQLWLVPIDGTTPTALTAPNDGQNGPDLGDVDAWHLPAGDFVQALGACGVIYLAKLDADGTTAPVQVPDVSAGTIDVVGVNGDSLRLQAKAACGGGISLVDYNPSTNTTTTLLGSPLNGGGVTSAVAFTGQR